MDQRLIAWARAVKARARVPLPPLWLFTDARRLPDPLPVAARLPPCLCGIVFRHDGATDRAGLARRLAGICRARRVMLVIAGDARLANALNSGLHLRRGQTAGGGRYVRRRGIVTSSAHGAVEIRRAAHAGAQLVFLSPWRSSASHPGQDGLGTLRWARLARASRVPVLALGGVDGRSIRGLPRFCRGAGAIGAFL